MAGIASARRHLASGRAESATESASTKLTTTESNIPQGVQRAPHLFDFAEKQLEESPLRSCHLHCFGGVRVASPCTPHFRYPPARPAPQTCSSCSSSSSFSSQLEIFFDYAEDPRRGYHVCVLASLCPAARAAAAASGRPSFPGGRA